MTLSTISSTIDPDTGAELWDEDAGAPRPERWDGDHVGRRLVDAFRTLDRLPRPKGPRQAGNHWPLHRVEWADRLAQAELPERERRERERRQNDLAFRPSGGEIARMDAALDWLRDLRGRDPDLALLVTLWAYRTVRRRPLRALAQELGISPPTFYKRRDRALAWLAETLEAQAVPVF